MRMQAISPSEPRARRGAAALVLLALATFGTLAVQFDGPVLGPTPWRAGDTLALTTGAKVVHRCLADGVFRRCGQPAPPLDIDGHEIPTSRAERFPPLLYVPTLVVYGLGMGQATAIAVIGVLNAASFVLVTALPWLARRRLARLYRFRFVWALVLLCGMALPYSSSSWSEPLAAALAVGAVAGVAARWPAWCVVLLALGAGLAKDTMGPFVVLLGLAVAGAGSVPSWRSHLRAVAPLLAGSALALVATMAFNLFRFGTVRNVTYLAPLFRVHRPGGIGGQLLALVTSPNGGIVAYWPIVVVPAVIAVLGFRRADAWGRLRLALVVTAVAGFALLLAMWWSPFGWHAWGSRLLMPIVPAAVLALLVVVDVPSRMPTALAAVAAVAVVLSLPNVAVLGVPDKVSRFMTTETPCERPELESGDRFVPCTLEAAWRKRPFLVVDVLSGLRDPGTALLAALNVGAGLVLVARASRPEPASVVRPGSVDGRPRRRRRSPARSPGPG